jgi:hypothetical protein
MSVHYRLASHRATVNSDVETQHARILFQDEISGFSQQLLAGSHLSRSKVEIVASMPLRDNKKVPFGYRVSVPHNHGEAVLK